MGTKNIKAMSYKELKQEVYETNLQIVKHNLVTLTWGNTSAIDRGRGVFAIKPSGVAYELLTWQDIVLVDLEGQVVEKGLKPSSDTATHLELYLGFNEIGAVVHTHSRWATIWAQAGKDLPALGTTHADHFNGPVPCVPPLGQKEVDEAYEKSTGVAIVQTFSERGIDPVSMPACLLANHASFSWGKSSRQAFENAVALEDCAMMAYHTLMLNGGATLPDHILNKHYERKHGKNAYYGQKGG